VVCFLLVAGSRSRALSLGVKCHANAMAGRSTVRTATRSALGSKPAAAVSMPAPMPAGPNPSPVPVVPVVLPVPMPVPVVPAPGVKVPVPGVPPIVPPVVGVIVPTALYKAMLLVFFGNSDSSVC